MEVIPGGGGRSLRSVPGGALKYLVGAIVLIAILFFMNPLVIIGAGERGVVMNFGAVSPEVLNEGLHIRVPFMQKVIKVDVKVHKSQTDAEAASRDLQDTQSVIAVNYHILPDKANWIYQNIGKDYKERIIDPAVQEVVKAVTAKYTAVELITQREKVRAEIKELLKTRLIVYNIIVDDFSIMNFSFSKQFAQAIENKQAAEQLALKAQRDLDRIKIEAQQKIASAQAEAESLRLQRQNVTAELVELRRIEAMQEAIRKWNGVLPTVTGGAMPFIDAKSYSGK